MLRDTGEGGRGVEPPLLPFDKSALFMLANWLRRLIHDDISQNFSSYLKKVEIIAVTKESVKAGNHLSRPFTQACPLASWSFRRP